MSHLLVLRPGARSSVEDLGRFGCARSGIPTGGAFDRLALIAANRLVGNDDGEAGLEVTLLGPELEYEGDDELAVAIAGASFEVRVDGRARTREIEVGDVARLAAGDRLQIGAARDGARVWLGIAGGIDVPIVLGSRSTCTAGRFGGIHGRPLRAGDRIALRPARPASPASRVEPWRTRAPRPDIALLRILPGPQLDEFPSDALGALEDSLWRVAEESNRIGVRLTALDPRVAERIAGFEGIAPEGTTIGAIQVLPDGSPVVLGPDRPVTGGYAKPALVAEADLGELGALRPGDRVRFRRIALDEALELAAARRDLLPPKAHAR